MFHIFIRKGVNLTKIYQPFNTFCNIFMFQIRIQAIDSKQLGTLLFKPFAAHLKMKFGVPFYFLVSELEIEF